MLSIELINNNIPRLHLQDSVRKALQLFSDFRVTHLPVVSDDKFLGLISEEDLLDAESDKLPIESMQDSFTHLSVLDNEHFLRAVKFSNESESNIVPVINEENEFQGSITTSELLKTLGHFTEIGRIVESNNATILHLNTTVNSETAMFTVTIHTNKKEIASIVSTFERYEFDVIYYFGNENFENDIHSNYRHLMNYLDI
jgi:acetoin utilization protein AcuB